MENTKTFNYSRIILFSIIGIVIFFVPIKINNEYETIIYHVSYFVENKFSVIIDISIVFFILLSIFDNLINKTKTKLSKSKIVIKIFSFILFVSILIGKEDTFFINDDLILILRDLMLDLSILLPVSSLFMPLLLDFGLTEIIEAYMQKFMKKMFKVSGVVFLNFLIYLLVNNVCGAFVTYKLYKDGKLREKETVITILNFSVLSLNLTKEIAYKIDISIIELFVMEMIVLCIINFIISRIYPIKKKKQSYYFKSEHKNVNCKRHKVNRAIEIYNKNKSNKNIISLSLSYLNDVIYILMDIIPTIIFIFFIANMIYNISPIINVINNLIYIIIIKFNFPNSTLLSNIISLNIFSNILAIKNISQNINYISKMIIGIFISLQCISISFLIPFIKNSIINLKITEIIVVIVERFFFILLICYIFYLKYLI